ncbi:hypothetical protein MIZ03_2008 [Rhodoferax lithotrophicus]|uniref:Uncharacterized protein n=1 Tax=Rhodoferax lithotrophicus TaxID=2798804 RepID=A0ABN6D8G4_9BURK|nr:hypothetical protein MIZ03_2008 [Rhodoferax sp. MIZ03]
MQAAFELAHPVRPHHQVDWCPDMKLRHAPEGGGTHPLQRMHGMSDQRVCG